MLGHSIRRWTTLSLSKKKKLPHVSVVTCVLPGFPDTCPFSCVSCPGSKTVKKKNPLFEREVRWPQMVSTQGDFCAVLYTVFGGDS